VYVITPFATDATVYSAEVQTLLVARSTIKEDLPEKEVIGSV